MNYTKREINDNGYEDSAIAACLAHIAGFPNGSRLGRRSESHSARTSCVVFHMDTVAQDPDMYLATQNPDIYVNRILGDKCVIEFNERVPEYLIEQLPEKLRKWPLP
jgi:hypothetical protein